MRAKILLLFVFFFVQISFGQKKYSPVQIAEDFEYLYKTLEASHYDLYTNTSKKDFDKEFKSVKASIKDSMTSIQVFRLFQPFVALDRHAHCQVSLPFSLYGEYYENEGTVFPLNLSFRNNRVFVINNFSSDERITPGDEIVTLNGMPIKEIMDEMHAFFSGESDYLKSTLIEMLTFPRLFWVIYGRSDEFKLELRKKENNNTINIAIDAITAEEFESKNAMEEPLMNNNRDFHFINNVAYLHPGVFVNLNAKNEHESSDKRKFCHFIDSCFIEIYKSQSQNLIIDLRNNPGGHNSFSDYMISYIADRPFRFSNKFMVKTSERTKDFWKEVSDTSLSVLKNNILIRENGTRFVHVLPFNQPQTDSLCYTGRVYVLINRYDFSQAVNAAAVVQDYKFGILIGEQTADHSSLFGSSHTFTLPNTELTVQYPKAFIVRPNGDEKAEGVVPDYKIGEDLFNDDDEILTYTLELIKEDTK